MKYLFFIFFLINISSFGQSKSETESWIIDKYLSYKLDNWAHKNNILKIENGYLVLIKSYGWYEKILIKDIAQVKVSYFKVEDREGYTINVYCKNNGKCIQEGENNSDKNTTSKNLNNFMTIYVKVSFGQDDLPLRMEKALIYLVKLYGGDAKKYKEAF